MLGEMSENIRMFVSYFKEGCKVVQDMGVQIDNILDY
jgi:hypothetical protein